MTVIFLTAQLLLATVVMSGMVTSKAQLKEYIFPVPTVETSGELQEGSVVNITCSTTTLQTQAPPKLTWNLHQHSLNTTGNQTFTKIQASVTLTEKHNGFNVTCVATYPVNKVWDVVTAQKTLTLHVSYPPKDTMVVISPTDLVSLGTVVHLTCSCRSNPSQFNFFWVMLSDGRLTIIKEQQQVYSFRVTDSDRDRLYFCGCPHVTGVHFSTGFSLTFEGGLLAQILGSIEVIAKTVGVAVLFSTLLIFEWYFRARKHTRNPQKVTTDTDYVND